MLKKIKQILDESYSHQKEFCQAVLDTAVDIEQVFNAEKSYCEMNVIERLIVPDRIINFRVTWENDKGEIKVNRGWRVQFHNELGPYKGGLRFHPSVNESILKFLGFEQTLKCALTGLPMGGGKGGADFNPKGKSEKEIRRFCYAFIQALYHYIGEHVDVPAGDIGVGTREISYMFGHYLSITNIFTGVLTGKHPTFGGSCGREEATGYGCIFFLEEVLNAHDDSLKGKTILISGAGNVSLHVAEKAIQEQAKVLTLSDTSGLLYCKPGFDIEMLQSIKRYKFEKRQSLKHWHKETNYKQVEFKPDCKPWSFKADIAIPCATENEIGEQDAKSLIDNQIKLVIEGANMPLTTEAIKLLQENNVIFVPGKAANCGGVAVSSLEITQNAMHTSWPLAKVQQELHKIMQRIHHKCTKNIEKVNGVYPYKKGANIAAFKQIANAMVSYGIK